MRKILGLKLIYVPKNQIFSNDFIASKSNIVLYNPNRPHFTKKVRQMDHDNLNKFMGVCVDGPIYFALWKCCQRGSVKVKLAYSAYNF